MTEYDNNSIESVILANTFQAIRDLYFLKHPDEKKLIHPKVENTGDFLFCGEFPFGVEETPDGNYAFKKSSNAEILATMNGYEARQAMKRGKEMGIEPARDLFNNKPCGTHGGDPAFFIQWVIDQFQKRRQRNDNHIPKETT